MLKHIFLVVVVMSAHAVGLNQLHTPDDGVLSLQHADESNTDWFNRSEDGDAVALKMADDGDVVALKTADDGDVVALKTADDGDVVALKTADDGDVIA